MDGRIGFSMPTSRTATSHPEQQDRRTDGISQSPITEIDRGILFVGSVVDLIDDDDGR